MASANPTINEREARCGCVVRYGFNPTEPVESRLHTPVEWAGRKGCAAHGHDDHREHFKRLRVDDLAKSTAVDPKHGWTLVHEDPATGAIRDVFTKPKATRQ